MGVLIHFSLRYNNSLVADGADWFHHVIKFFLYTTTTVTTKMHKDNKKSKCSTGEKIKWLK